MAKKSAQSQVTKAVKKAAKKNPKRLIIAIIAIVLIIAIAVAVVYFVFPDTWNSIMSMINQDKNTSDPASPSSNLVHSDGTLFVEYVDVEQGDCQIIIFPDGKTMMIDGGDTGYAAKVQQAMDDLSITSLDYVILTHTDADHCGSLDDAINHAEYVENVYLPKIKSKDYDLGLSSSYLQKTTVVYNNFVKAAKNAVYKDADNNEIPANLIFTEDIITIEDAAHTYKFTMYCRNDTYYTSMKDDAHDLNDVSPICVLEFNGRIMVFTGDANKSSIETSSEKAFLDRMQALGYTDDTFDADVLKVPHHGGRDSSGADFLDFIDCEYAIVCVGGTQSSEKTEYALFINETLKDAGDYMIYENAKYGHPTHEVCAENGRLDEAGIQYAYYTWFNGDITCTIDRDGNITFACSKNASSSGSEIAFA